MLSCSHSTKALQQVQSTEKVIDQSQWKRMFLRRVFPSSSHCRTVHIDTSYSGKCCPSHSLWSLSWSFYWSCVVGKMSQVFSFNIMFMFKVHVWSSAGRGGVGHGAERIGDFSPAPGSLSPARQSMPLLLTAVDWRRMRLSSACTAWFLCLGDWDGHTWWKMLHTYRFLNLHWRYNTEKKKMVFMLCICNIWLWYERGERPHENKIFQERYFF